MWSREYMIGNRKYFFIFNMVIAYTASNRDNMSIERSSTEKTFWWLEVRLNLPGNSVHGPRIPWVSNQRPYS